MDKTLAGMIGSVAMAALPAHASQPPATALEAALHAESYADLLRPIPNARALIAEANQPERLAQQYYYYPPDQYYAPPPQPYYYPPTQYYYPPAYPYYTPPYWHHHHHHHHHHHQQGDA